MADRLSPLDVSFLYLEEPPATMHVGSVMIFEAPPGGVDIDRIRARVLGRIAFVPRYRQRVRFVPARLANPVWVDAEDFDIADHVTPLTLPEPGTDDQLAGLVADFQAAALDRAKPLWDMLVVNGLSENRFAVVTKVHQALVDGVNAVDLGQVILEDDPGPLDDPEVPWRAVPEPSNAELLATAVIESIGRPNRIWETFRSGVADTQVTAARALRAVGGLVVAARTATNPPPRSPLNVELSDRRRFVMVTANLDDYRRVRRVLSESQDELTEPLIKAVSTVNDVVLAVVAGALRMWLLSRGQAVLPASTVRALVPISVELPNGVRRGALGSRVTSLLIDLPIGEPSPLMRVYQVSYQTKAHRENGQAVDARRLAEVAGFAPPTLHSMGARVASGLSRRLFNLVITNVPGPQEALYFDGHRMLSSFPVIPLALGQALSIGVTSYDGDVHVGLFGDREAMPDLDVLGQCLRESLAETVEAASQRVKESGVDGRLRRPTTARKASSANHTTTKSAKAATTKPVARKRPADGAEGTRNSAAKRSTSGRSRARSGSTAPQPPEPDQA